MEAVLKKEEEAAATRASPGFPRPLLFGDAPPCGEGTGGTLHHMGGVLGRFGSPACPAPAALQSPFAQAGSAEGQAAGEAAPGVFLG